MHFKYVSVSDINLVQVDLRVDKYIYVNYLLYNYLLVKQEPLFSLILVRAKCMFYHWVLQSKQSVHFCNTLKYLLAVITIFPVH